MRTETKYLFAVLAGVLATTGLYFALVLGGIGVSPGAKNVSAMYKHKSSAAKSDKPKVLLLGGSSVSFGLRASELSELVDRHAVNYGTHAGLQLDYMLHAAKPSLAPGDAVLLALEFQLVQKDREPSALTIEYVMSFDRSFLAEVSGLERIRYLFGTPLDRRILGLFGAGQRQDNWKFNEFGDTTINQADKQTKRQRKKVARAGPLAFPKIGFPRSEAFTRLGHFVEWCRKRDVAVVAILPPVMDRPEHRGPDAEKAIEQYRSRLKDVGVELLGDLESALYPQSAFFDTALHLNAENASKRTREIAELLEPALRQ